MIKTINELITLAGTQSNLIIDIDNLSTNDVIQIVGTIGINGGHITLRKCSSKSTNDLLQISSVYPKNITFDLTN